MAQEMTAKPISRDLLLGSWRMTSWMTRDVATGELREALGQDPHGIVIYTPERVIFFILRNNRSRPDRLPPSAEEKIALFDSMFAYSGSYTVESDRVVHHVDMSWNEAWSGTEQVRFCNVDEHTLTYTSPPAQNPFDGREIVHEVTYVREKHHAG
ncbi:lipocalin-like domain-containing protein [Mesorhizobium caraganae]|uniref:lipocalin-like domain-containing protein n=1 Tax=Mesorhizobium caraganae TaxID=483206 RepID=UPI00177E79F3|nr:lipocalin-like domain-containing protein [Mesorhizobium caraganae]